MAEVKRRYTAPIRAEQAAETRRRVLEAAAVAFAEHGWAGTTIADVARAAGITPQAVHLSVGAKPALLIGAVHYAVAGGRLEVPLVQRQPFARAYAPDAELPDRAAAFAAGATQVYRQAGRLFLVLAHAAGVDPDLAALWERARAARLQDCRRLVDLTGRRTRARQNRLADLLFVQSGPGVYNDLVNDRNWSPGVYRTWLGATVVTLLDTQH